MKEPGISSGVSSEGFSNKADERCCRLFKLRAAVNSREPRLRTIRPYTSESDSGFPASHFKIRVGDIGLILHKAGIPSATWYRVLLGERVFYVHEVFVGSWDIL